MAAKKKPASNKMSANRPPEPPPFVRGKAKTNFNPISRAPGQQRPGAGTPKMNTKQLDAYRGRMGFNRTVLPAAKTGKGTGYKPKTAKSSVRARGGARGTLGIFGNRVIEN